MEKLNGLKILLAEDNPDHADLIMETLREQNPSNNITHVENGEEAINLLFNGQAFKPDLLLVDIKMPKLNGIETLEKIKTNPKTKHIPVLMVTTSTNTQEISACFYNGAASYITKPIGLENFVSKIKEISTYWSGITELPEGP